MKQQTRRLIIYVCVIMLVMIVAIDAFLYRVDPSGIYRYYSDLNDLFANTIPAQDGYRLAPGTYYFRTFRVTIGLDGLRVVPTTWREKCRMAFVGDSVTFGFGSDIAFSDLLATDLPATVINAGLPGYSAANVLAELDTIPADGYIWLIIENDDEPFKAWQVPSSASPLPSALSMYLSNGFIAPPAHNLKRFQRSADVILARDDVLAFSFEGRGLTDAIQQEFPQVHIIPYYTETVSWADSHPSENGHHQIAASMKDAVTSFAENQCAGK